MVRPNQAVTSSNNTILPVVTSSSSSGDQHRNGHYVPTVTSSSNSVNTNYDSINRFSALPVTSSSSAVATATDAAMAAATTNSLPLPPTTDVTMAYNLGMLPPAPPMGDDHSVPVFGDVPPSTTTTKHGNPFPQQLPGFHMAPPTTMHVNQNNSSIRGETVYGNVQKQLGNKGFQNEQAVALGFGATGGRPEEYPTGQWAGGQLQQPTLQSHQLLPQGMDMKKYAAAAAAAASVHGLHHPVLHANNAAHALPAGMDMNSVNRYTAPSSYAWGYGNGNQPPSNYDPYTMALYATMLRQQQEHLNRQQQANGNVVLPATFPSPYLTTGPPQQPLHWNTIGQVENPHHQPMMMDQMQTQPMMMPPTSQPKRPPSKEWIDSIVGRDMEIYWKKQGSQVVMPLKTKGTKGNTGTGTTMEGEETDNDDDEEETWYDGIVVAVDTKKSTSNTVYFHVKFLGDDDRMFTMPLTFDDVRPSARAWIRRTKAILLPPVGADVSKWEGSLPNDTSIASTDAVTMKQIDEEIGMTYPETLSVTYHQNQDESAVKAFQQLRDEHAAIIGPLLKVVRHQIYLRTKLSPIDTDHSVDGKDDDEDGSKGSTMSEESRASSVLTEGYVDFLVYCLRDLEKACLWHFKCWILLKQLFAVNREYTSSPTKLISHHSLVHDCFTIGQELLTVLAQQSNDILTRADNGIGNRKRTAISDQHGYNQTKRRRIHEQGTVELPKRNVRDVCIPVDIDGDAPDVARVLNRTYSNDQRWYTTSFGNMLYSVVDMVVFPYLEWKQNAHFYLSEDADFVGSKSLCELLHMWQRRSNVPKSKRGEFKYEEIELLIDNAKSNRLLKYFDFSDYVKRLCTKLAGIDVFEKDTLKLIAKVFKEPTTFSMNEDPVVSGLREQQVEASKKGGAVEGVNPIGHVTSRLTIKVIENAIENRQWFLNLNHAESVRERDAFVKELIAKKPLPDPPSLISKLYERVEALNCQGSDQLSNWNIESLLENRDILRREQKKSILDIKTAKKALHELQSQPRISSAEEKLSIRCDVLEWESKAQKILEGEKPKFVDLKSLHQSITSIRNGTAANHNYIYIETLPCTEVEATMNSFINSDFEAILGPLYAKTMLLYNESVTLKSRGDNILSAFDSYTNRSVVANANKLSDKIEMKDIEAILFEYSRSNVDISETFNRLEHLYDFAKKWKHSMQLTLTDTTKSFEDTRIYLMENEPSRPLGIFIEPDEKIVASVMQVLRWYELLKKYIASDRFDRDLLSDHLLVGMPMLELYCQSHHSITEFNIIRDIEKIWIGDITKKREIAEPIDISKLFNDKFCHFVIERLTNATKDAYVGSPMFFLYTSFWAITVDNFSSRCGSVTYKEHTTLENASRLWMAQPVSLQNSSGSMKGLQLKHSLHVQEFHDDVIMDGLEVENDARSAIDEMNNLQQQFWMDSIPSIFNKLKDIKENFASRREKNGQITLTLNSQLELEIDRSIRLAGWLNRILPYPYLYTENFPIDSTGVDMRVPLNILTTIYNDMPIPDLLPMLSSTQKCIKVLYDDASQWEKDITLLLSKRILKETSWAMQGLCSKEEFDKIVFLSGSRLLMKVSMPREQEIRDLIENVRMFEGELQLLFNEECCKDCPDAGTMGENSLAAEDGTFNLVMLTGNPLFEQLNACICNISEIAGRIDLNTTGKVAYEWICFLYCWIKSMKSSISDGIPHCRHFSISEVRAYELISQGDILFQELPVDLVQLLCLHNVYVETSSTLQFVTIKLGDTTVCNSLGLTLIRWGAFLFNAMKSDLSLLSGWNSAAMNLCEEYSRFHRVDDSKLTKDTRALILYYELRDQAERLLKNLDDLFLTPTSEVIGKCLSIHANCQNLILKNSSVAGAQSYVTSRYNNDEAVINNRLLLLDSLAERTELARYEVPVSDDINSSDINADKRDQFRRKLSKVLKNRIYDMMVTQTEAYDLCSIKAWEIENEIYDICDSTEYSTKAMSIKNGLMDVGNLQLTLSLLSGEITAEKLVKMPSEQFSNHDNRKMRDTAAEKARQKCHLTRQQEMEVKKAPSVYDSTYANRVASVSNTSSNTIAGKTNEMHSHGLTAVAESSIGNLIKMMVKAPVNQETKNVDLAKKVPSVLTRKYKDIVVDAPPPPPTLNPLSEALSKTTSFHSAPAFTDTKIQDFAKNNSGGSTFCLKVHSKKDKNVNWDINVQLLLLVKETGLMNRSLGDNVLLDRLRMCGFLKVEMLLSFMQDKLESGNSRKMTFKVCTKSKNAGDNLSSFIQNVDNENRICVLESKCDMDCMEKRCKKCDKKPCQKAYIITPKFQRQFANEWKTSDPDCTYIIALWRNVM